MEIRRKIIEFFNYNFEKRADIWMTCAFSVLDEKEMVSTLNEGTNLMNNLQIFFENNENIQVFFSNQLT